MTRVGLIGVGAMGAPMGKNLLKAGFTLSVWARRAEAAESLLDAGAVWADTPRHLAAASDVVILMVTNSPDVQALVLEGGVLDGAAPGTTIIDMSTISPTVSRTLAGICSERGVRFLDAPVSGGTQGAEAGTLTIMVGGDAGALEDVRPVLDAVGARIFHVGPSGSGEVMKLVNNLLVGTIAAATAEALVLGARAGADVQTMADVVGVSTGASWQLSNQFPLRAFNGSFRPGFMTDLLVKDLDLARQLAEENDVPLAVANVARELFGRAQQAGFGSDDYTSVLRVLEDAGHVRVRTDASDDS